MTVLHVRLLAHFLENISAMEGCLVPLELRRLLALELFIFSLPPPLFTVLVSLSPLLHYYGEVFLHRNNTLRCDLRRLGRVLFHF